MSATGTGQAANRTPPKLFARFGMRFDGDNLNELDTGIRHAGTRITFPYVCQSRHSVVRSFDLVVLLGICNRICGCLLSTCHSN